MVINMVINRGVWGLGITVGNMVKKKTDPE